MHKTEEKHRVIYVSKTETGGFCFRENLDSKKLEIDAHFKKIDDAIESLQEAIKFIKLIKKNQ